MSIDFPSRYIIAPSALMGTNRIKIQYKPGGGRGVWPTVFLLFLKCKWATMVSGSAFKPGQPDPKKWYKLLFCPSQKTSILNYEL